MFSQACRDLCREVYCVLRYRVIIPRACSAGLSAPLLVGLISGDVGPRSLQLRCQRWDIMLLKQTQGLSLDLFGICVIWDSKPRLSSHATHNKGTNEIPRVTPRGLDPSRKANAQHQSAKRAFQQTPLTIDCHSCPYDFKFRPTQAREFISCACQSVSGYLQTLILLALSRIRNVPLG